MHHEYLREVGELAAHNYIQIQLGSVYTRVISFRIFLVGFSYILRIDGGVARELNLFDFWTGDG